MRHYFAIVLSMIIWSSWGILIRWIDLPPVVVLFYTSLVASVTVPLALSLRGELHLNGVLAAWPWFAALALSSIINNLSYFYSLGHATVSNAVFTHYTAPVFVALLAPFLIGERLQRETMVSLPLAAAGMVLIVVAGGGLDLTGGQGPGIAAGTLSGVAYAFLIIISRKLSQMRMHHKAIIILLWITTCVTAVPALTLSYELTARKAGLLAVTGVLHSTAAPLLYFRALRHVIAQHAAILGYIEPLAAVPLAFLVLSEQPAALTLAGGMLILCSGYLVIRHASRASQDQRN
ncbi:MAG: DMT family transporter [Nitrospiraceae bacterium]|nr:DMT family transporter [Nitrospiraceae bacterium]